MKRPEPESPSARARAQSAAEWLVKRDRGLTASEQDEFLQWLAADPRHGEWLALHRSTIGDFKCLARWQPEHSEEPNPDLLAPPMRRPRPGMMIAFAAAASIAVVAIWWRHNLPAEKGAVAAEVASGFEQRFLPDGTKVDLNRGARVEMHYTAAERRVVLVRGEALFSVAKNPERPFVVHVRGVDIRAVGTAFNVRLADEKVEVLVTEGRVQVAPAGSPSSEGHSPLIEAGHRVTVALGSVQTAPQIIAVSQEETVRLLAWQPHLLDFSSLPLQKVVLEFNRRNSTQLVLADPTLAALPIVASIRSDNVEGLVRFLEANAGVRAERPEPSRIVLRRK